MFSLGGGRRGSVSGLVCQRCFKSFSGNKYALSRGRVGIYSADVASSYWMMQKPPQQFSLTLRHTPAGKGGE